MTTAYGTPSFGGTFESEDDVGPPVCARCPAKRGPGRSTDDAPGLAELRRTEADPTRQEPSDGNVDFGGLGGRGDFAPTIQR